MLRFAFALIAMIFVGTASAFAQEFPEYNLKVETVVENLEVPWAIGFSPDGRIFVTERIGKLRVIENDQLRPEPVMILSVGRVEGGLLGMALDPRFEENHYIYLYYTYFEGASTFNRVSRFVEKDNSISDEFILLDKIPGAAIHDGGRMRFGPDGKLYVTTGDAANADLAQDLDSLAGKILRINPDGTIPEDNPYRNSPVFSYGHRNPQGLDWDPNTGRLVITEHGPSGERGFAHDEINIVDAGKNYGWPIIVGDESGQGYVKPLFHTGNTAWAPSGASFYNSDKIPFFNGKFLVANLRGSHLHIFVLDTNSGIVTSHQEMFAGEFGRLRDVSVGNDGYLYVLTSNRDGRGSPQPNDDRILRITPLKEPTVYESPLKQTKSGTEPHDVKCNDGFLLTLKHRTGAPACVRPETLTKLIERSWAAQN